MPKYRTKPFRSRSDSGWSSRANHQKSRNQRAIPRAFIAACAILFSLHLGTPQATAADDLPRFASLRAERVNVRSGPGVQYPISWVFVRRGLPVEITAEFEFWRKIRDRDGSEGWIHQSLISGSRTALVIDAVRPLHNAPSTSAPILLYAEPGVQGELQACQTEWCEIRIAGRTGWMQRSHLWGARPGEGFE